VGCARVSLPSGCFWALAWVSKRPSVAALDRELYKPMKMGMVARLGKQPA